MPTATIQCLGASRTVTGSKFLLETAGRRLLVDCGLHQGLKDLRLRNWDKLPVDPARIDAVALTHAHIDHIGYLPRLVKDGFGGTITATRGTQDLARIMLPDSGHLQEEEAAYHNRRGTSKHTPALPLYTAEEGARAAETVTGIDYRKPMRLPPGLQGTFRRAGHILGSASVHLELEAGAAPRRLVFSGDIGRYAAPILLDPEPIDEADYIFVESTYGDRRHDPTPIPDQIERVVRAAVDRGARSGGARLRRRPHPGADLPPPVRSRMPAASPGCRPSWTARWRSRRRASTAPIRRTWIRTRPSR